MKIVKIDLFALLIFLSFRHIVIAGDPGTVGATFLEMAEGPRAVGMGEAQIAVANDSYASYWNPAGLSYLKAGEVAMTYQKSFQDVKEQQANVAIPLRHQFGVGAYATRTSVASFDGFDANGNSAGSVDADDTAYGIALGYRPRHWLGVGAGLKFIRSNLGPASASSHAVDVAFLTEFPSPLKKWPTHRLSFGATIKNIGPGMVYDREETSLPRTFGAGLGYKAPIGKNRLIAAADYNVPSGGSSYATLGQEFWFQNILALRAGYRFSQPEGSGVRFGLAFAFRNVQLAYSLSPFGFLGDSHRFGLSYQFGAVQPAAAPMNVAIPRVAPPAPPQPPSVPPAPMSLQISSSAAQMPVVAPKEIKPAENLQPPPVVAPPDEISPKAVHP